MTRQRIITRLELVEAQISLVQVDIEAQRVVVGEMHQKGYGTMVAETHLTIHVARLAGHQAEHARLLTELAAHSIS